MDTPDSELAASFQLSSLPGAFYDDPYPTYRALRDLADGYRGGGLPFLIAFYWKEPWVFRVLPVNAKAAEWFTSGEVVSERTFVTRLYLMRTLVIRDEVVSKLCDTIPSVLAA